MEIKHFLNEARLALLIYAPEQELRGGVGTYVGHLKKALPTLQVFPLPEWTLKSAVSKIRFKTWYLDLWKNDILYCRLLEKVHKERPFDLLLTHSLTGLSPCILRLGIPVINIFFGCFREYLSHTASKTLSTRLQQLIGGVMEKRGGRGKYNVTLSEKVKEEIQSAYGYSCNVIPVGINLDINPRNTRKKEEILKDLKLDGKGPTGLFVGRAEPAKGWPIVLALAKSFPNVRFVCITDRPAGEDGNLIFKKGISPEELRQWYGASDFFLMPSLYESACYVALEAMSHNLPVVMSPPVASVIFGPHFLRVDDGIYIADHESQYVTAVQKCIQKGSRAVTRPFIEENYSFQKFSERYQQLVTELL